ncbi:MAG TPA: hypothetical protein VEC99_09435 [Clostridia bacterium]|nr:hypothetical protein [Clostridia bacterium]
MAIVLSPVAMISMSVLVQKGFRSDLLVAAALPFLLYAAIMLTICSTRVSVSRNGIGVSSYFVFNRFVPFADIDHSEVQILAERDHPAFVAVHYREGEKERTLTLSLKPYHKEDAAWFCGLPEIKAKKYGGFTKRAEPGVAPEGAQDTPADNSEGTGGRHR